MVADCERAAERREALPSKVSSTARKCNDLTAQARETDKRVSRGEECGSESDTEPRENTSYWERADPVGAGAGDASGTVTDGCQSSPRGLRQHRVIQRSASNQASDEQGLLGKRATQYPSMYTNVTRGVQMAASRVMRTGKPQRLAMKRGNALGVKVLTCGQPSRRKH